MQTEGQSTAEIGHGEVVTDFSDNGIPGVDVLTHGGALIDLTTRIMSLQGGRSPLGTGR